MIVARVMLQHVLDLLHLTSAGSLRLSVEACLQLLYSFAKTFTTLLSIVINCVHLYKIILSKVYK